MEEKDDSSLKSGFYCVHPAVSMVQAIIRNLSENTGRSLDGRIRLVRESGPPGEKAQRAWLKNEYKLGGQRSLYSIMGVAGQNPSSGSRRTSCSMEKSLIPYWKTGLE